MPPRDDAELVLEATQEAAAPLKKIITAKGNLHGFFYFASDNSGTSAGLIITLSARDPKGAKAAAQGKALKKAISGAKFARGRVLVEDSTLVFEHHAGSAGPDLMQRAFRKSLSEVDGMQRLRKAEIRQATADTDEAPAPYPASLDLTGLSADEAQEITMLIAEQEALDGLAGTLEAAFLSAEAAAQEEEEQLQALLSQISTLEEQVPLNEAALAEARHELAATLYQGMDPFPAVGEPISAGLRQVMRASVEALSRRLGSELQGIAQRMRQICSFLESSGAGAPPASLHSILAESRSHQAAARTVARQLEAYL